VSDEDRQVIERAIAAAKRRNPAIEESIFNFLRDILLFRFPENLDAQGREEHLQFVLRFQQFTGPIMAKGLEDTAFYIYNRLAALNEVGGEPQQFGLSVDAFHERNLIDIVTGRQRCSQLQPTTPNGAKMCAHEWSRFRRFLNCGDVRCSGGER